MAPGDRGVGIALLNDFELLEGLEVAGWGGRVNWPQGEWGGSSLAT